MSTVLARKHKPALKQGNSSLGCCASLPPHVDGQSKGRLHVHVASLEWVHSIEPPSWTLAVRLQWWGEDGPGTVFRVPVKKEGAVDHVKAGRGYLVTNASYSIKSSRPKFAAYLRDMQPLVLEVGLGRVPVASMCVGKATVANIKDLVSQESVEGEYPVVDRDGVVLARLRVHLHLEMGLSPLRPANPPPKVSPLRPASPPQNRTVRFDIPGESTGDRRHVCAVESSPFEVPPMVPVAGCAHEEVCATPPTDEVEPGDLLYKRLMQKSHKLRESLVRSLLTSEEVYEEVERRGRNLEGELEDERVSPEQRSLPSPQSRADVVSPQPLPLGGVWGRVAEENLCDAGVIGLVTGGGVDQWAGSPGRIAADSDSEMDVTLSSQSSDHPLRDSSLLDKLVYSHPLDSSEDGSEGEALPSTVVVQAEKEEEEQLSRGAGVQKGGSDKEAGGQGEGPREKAPARGGERRAGCLRRGLGRPGQLREGHILRLLGMERLTTLGRVGAVRMEVGQLEMDRAAFLEAHHDVTPLAYCGSVFFVEYSFPVTAGETAHHTKEVMRVASRKMATTGVVSFNHCSLFPASFTRKVICDWWQETVVFRVYIRLPQQRMPRLVGKSSLPLQSLLRAGGVEVESVLGVHPADLSSAFSPTQPGQKKLGTLMVRSLLVPRGGRKGPPGVQHLPTASQEPSGGDSPSSEDDSDSLSPPPLEKKVVHACPQVQGALVQPSPAVVTLQLLLFLPEAVELTVQPGAKEPPNSYVVCRLFCATRPPPATDVVWSSVQPQFNHRLVFPLALSASLLSQLCNGVMVVEVWHKTAGAATEDQLLGLVKVSLSQFYLAFADSGLVPSLLETEYPVVAMDSYCPITSPLTGSTHGHLGVLLALGSSQQVSRLMQHYASGRFLLRQPHPIAHSQSRHRQSSQEEVPTVPHVDEAREGAPVVVHCFEVTIEAVRKLPALNTAIWGEADCFVQYHFPAPAPRPEEQEACPEGDPAFPLRAHRTPTVLCIPDPVLDQSQCHALPLPPGRPVQHVLLAAYHSHEVPFQVWKRFYYPNTRDQLVSKGCLPLAKLCALVTMRRVGTPGRGQPFTIPLTPTEREGGGEETGELHVRVAYSCEEEGQGGGAKKDTSSSLITLSVDVLRACGLKEAAEMCAAEREPLIMGQPARDGVNALVRLRLPQGIIRDCFHTNPVARSFSPEFSHHFAIALPLDGGGGVRPALAEALLQGMAVFEVWHKVDQMAPQTSLSGGVTSRPLQHPPKEVLLGVAEVPLIQLLDRETGVHGWLSIVHSPAWSPTVGVVRAENQEVDKAVHCLGGLEVSLTFASNHHRELVLQQARAGGWSPRGAEWGGHECVRWHLCISRVQVSEDSVHYPTCSSLSKLCYLRYKVYDRKPTVTAAHRTAAVQGGLAVYHFSHSAATLLPVTESLKWYLKEECLELQVWLSGRAGHHRPRPCAEDTLLGCCYIPLSGLSQAEHSEGRVQGSYPLFKPGASSLGGSCVQLELSLQPKRLADCKGLTHEMEISDSSDIPSTVLSSSPSHGDQEVEEGEEEGEAVHVEQQRQLEAANLFDATLHIHQAALTKDTTTEGSASVYAVVHPHPLVERITTPCAPVMPRPSWNHHSKTKIPRELLDSHSLGLQVQVWLRKEKGDDPCLGCAMVDLSPLGYGMPLLSGWYNVADFAGQCVGQLQITVAPDPALRPAAVGQPPAVVPLVCSTQSLSRVSLPAPQASGDAFQLTDKTTSFLRMHLRENISELEELRDGWTARLRQTHGELEREEPVAGGGIADCVPPAGEGRSHDLEGDTPQQHLVEEGEESEDSNTPLSVTPEASESGEERCSSPPAVVKKHCTGGPMIGEAPPVHEEPMRTEPEVDMPPMQVGKVPSLEYEPPLPSVRSVPSSSHSTSSASGSGSSDSEEEGCVHDMGTAFPPGQKLPNPASGDLVRGPRLPNFFLPPQELQETMRSLRLTALSRPPPTYTHPPPGRQVSSGDSSLMSTPERLEQSLEQLLRSYRQGRTVAQPKATFDARETDRIARIFASKPNVT